jgi:secreted PhoX family phosphatase
MAALPSSSRRLRPLVAGIAVAALAAGSVYALSRSDPGAAYEQTLSAQSNAIFGFGHPLAEGSTNGVNNAPGAGAVAAAQGLDVSLVSDTVGEDADMIALWPNDTNPTQAYICNEINSVAAGNVGKPTVQRVDLATGDVTDLITGTTSCDPIHVTAWGTLVFGEENGAIGRIYEIFDPTSLDGDPIITVNHTTGTSSDPDHVAVRTALGQLSYEGIVVLPDGTVYYSDELRPSGGKPGGGMYKFVPVTPHTGGAISDIDESPLVNGSVYVMRLGLRAGGGTTDFGQGSNTGAGKWVALASTPPSTNSTYNLAAQALAAGGYTGFYRPEDIDLDPAAFSDGRIRMCWNNTGNDTQQNWGETLCLEDQPTDATGFPTAHRPTVEPFVIGSPELRMPDNLDFQPGTGILYVLQDASTTTEGGATNDSVWACLPDGADADILSDGCVRVLNSLDAGAEWTGIQFLADGKSFLIDHQHRTQDGRAVPETTDMLRVSGLAVN